MGHTCRTSLAAAICMMGASKGVPLPELLAILRLAPADLANADRHVPLDLIVEALRRIEVACPDRALGLDMAEMTPGSAWGLVQVASMAAATVMDALQVYARYTGFLSTAASGRVVRGRHHTQYLILHHPSVEAIAHPIDVGVALGTRNLRSAGARPDLVTFKHAPRGDPARYEQVLGCPVLFEQPLNTLRLPNDEVDKALPTRDPELSLHARKQLETLWPRERRPGSSDLRTRVARRAFEARYEVGRVADLLGVSMRTLQRQARSEGTTLRDVMQEVRIEQAKELLGDPTLAVEDVAFLVKYSDLRGFTRAFKRVTGTTPAAYRSDEAS